MAGLSAAEDQGADNREMRREVRWSHDNGARLIVLLTDGRQLAGVVTAIEDDTFDLDGENLAFRSVRTVYRVVESSPLAKPKSHGFSEKWLWIAFAAYVGRYIVIALIYHGG